MPHITSIFRNGKMQAVRIPKDFELPEGKVAITRNEDGSLNLRPAMTLAEFVMGLQGNPDADVFNEIEDLVAEPVEL